MHLEILLPVSSVRYHNRAFDPAATPAGLSTMFGFLFWANMTRAQLPRDNGTVCDTVREKNTVRTTEYT